MTSQGRDLYLDCYSGIAGDMMLGALLDLGVPEGVVAAAIAALGLPHIELHTQRVRRGALVGCKVEVMHHGHATTDEHGVGHHHDHDHRHYTEIRALIEARSTPDVTRYALAIFDRIAAVEAKIHGVPLAEVAFHEVGASDSIADIVGCAAAIAWLRPRSIACRPVPLGGGTVKTAHGILPVPAPATLALLAGCEVEAGGDSELTTPTGAAIIAACATSFGPLPKGRVHAIGWGAGTRELADRPNLLRVVALDRAQSEDEIVLLEANLDDMSGELLAPLIDALMAAGAVDAWLAPITMKKGRPAHVVSALVPATRVSAVEDAFFRESTTLGVRRSPRARTVLDREMVSVQTELGAVSVKVSRRGDVILNAAPELEDCRRIASERVVPLRRVYELALAAAASLRR